MKITGVKRKSNIINNIEYMLRKTGENKTSLAQRTGVTRTTLYKILEGRVNRVQHSTVTRIADFFGVNCDVIEHYDMEELDRIDSTLSMDGNKNPAAVPVIPQNQLPGCMDIRIGRLVTLYPVVWAFIDDANLIALSVEEPISKTFFPGDLLILKRYAAPEKNQPALYYHPEHGLIVQDHHSASRILAAKGQLIATIIEERIS